MRKSKVIIGKKYGKLTPVSVAGRNKHGLLLYDCICDCGNTKTVGSRYLTEGKTVSCGCKRACSNHHSDSPTYKSWISAKQRCENPNNHNYTHYGARGIKMCERWANSFNNFLEDMGERPTKCTLERIDVNGDYAPDNCKWATPKEQGNNRRNNRYIYIENNKFTVSQFVDKYNLNRSNVDYELRRDVPPIEILRKYCTDVSFA